MVDRRAKWTNFIKYCRNGGNFGRLYRRTTVCPQKQRLKTGISGKPVLDLRSPRRVAARKTSPLCPLNFSERDGIDPNTRLPHLLKDMNVRAGLLRIANDVECGELRDATADRGSIVNPERRSIFGGKRA